MRGILRRYFFLPIISIAGSTLLAFTVMVPIALHSAVSNVAPNLIMVLSIALAVSVLVGCFRLWKFNCNSAGLG